MLRLVVVLLGAGLMWEVPVGAKEERCASESAGAAVAPLLLLLLLTLTLRPRRATRRWRVGGAHRASAAAALP